MANLDDEMALIKDYVDAYRRNYGIDPSPCAKFELSCEAYGEGWNLLYTQLAHTTDGSGYWPLIKSDPEIRKLVLDQIEKDKLMDAVRNSSSK